MAELKTKVNDRDPRAFIGAVQNKQRREDALVLLEVLSELTGEPPRMWGESIVGFGSMRYTNTAGENEWMVIGFSPRKQSMSVYFMNGFKEYVPHLQNLGKHKLGKSCL